MFSLLAAWFSLLSFCEGDTHLLNKGQAVVTDFTFQLEENQKNTKTVDQLIAEFGVRAQEEEAEGTAYHLYPSQ